MKKMIIALALLGLAWSGAEAKTKIKIKGDQPACTVSARKATVHRYAKKLQHHPRTVSFVKNHQVCTDHGGYYTCCVYNDKRKSRW